MENNKPRKISFTILAFFYIFLQIFKVFLQKKKGKGINPEYGITQQVLPD